MAERLKKDLNAKQLIFKNIKNILKYETEQLRRKSTASFTKPTPMQDKQSLMQKQQSCTAIMPDGVQRGIRKHKLERTYPCSCMDFFIGGRGGWRASNGYLGLTGIWWLWWRLGFEWKGAKTKFWRFYYTCKFKNWFLLLKGDSGLELIHITKTFKLCNFGLWLDFLTFKKWSSIKRINFTIKT